MLGEAEIVASPQRARTPLKIAGVRPNRSLPAPNLDMARKRSSSPRAPPHFSEKLDDPNDQTSAIEFYLTVDGQQPRMFDMSSGIPDIVAQQGTVEDWIIENRVQRTPRLSHPPASFTSCCSTTMRASPSTKISCATPSTCPTSTRKRSHLPQRPLAHGLPRPEHRRNLPLPLPYPGTRRQSA